MSKTLVFLCSGGGGNLRFVHHAIRQNWIANWSKVVVIADRDCPAIDFARECNLANFICDFRTPEQRDLIELTKSFDPDLIITTVHRILCTSFISLFRGRLLNLHYSLLPAFAGSIGTKPVRDALEHGVRLIGATVHSVTEIVDDGMPQAQVAFPVFRADNTEETMNLVFRAGCFVLLTALKNSDGKNSLDNIGGHIIIGNRPALINPFIDYPKDLSDECFWNSLK